MFEEKYLESIALRKGEWRDLNHFLLESQKFLDRKTFAKRLVSYRFCLSDTQSGKDIDWEVGGNEQAKMTEILNIFKQLVDDEDFDEDGWTEAIGISEG